MAARRGYGASLKEGQAQTALCHLPHIACIIHHLALQERDSSRHAFVAPRLMRRLDALPIMVHGQSRSEVLHRLTNRG
jgi:hypothetical protein